ncbi:MAG: hypothetical protein ACFFBR_09810 [Promethearchaeota archaeon]
MYINRRTLLVIQSSLCVAVLFVNPVVHGREMQVIYGYSVGDIFTFRDITQETVELNQTHINEDYSIEYQLRIRAIDENIDGFTIRLTTEILDISFGLPQFNYSSFMEGHTPIVSGPQVVFTHTIWSIHSVQFAEDADAYQANTQMSGTVEEDSQLHLYHWNLSRYINANISTYDMDQDGAMDSFTSIAGFTAWFNDDGVLLLREFITDFRFDNGAHYYRLRQILLLTGMPSGSLVITPDMGLIISVVVIVTLGLILLTLYWFRRELSSPE